MYAVLRVMRVVRDQQMQPDADRELEQEVAALLWLSVLTDRTDELLDRPFTNLQQSKFNVLDWAGHVQEECTIYMSHCKRATMTSKGMLYQVRMLF